MRKPIPYGKHHITEDDIAAVVETLRGDFITQGPKIQEFEKAFAEYVGARYAVALANGTAALHLACLSLGVGPGDSVITTPITFVASANCVLYCGGEVLLADIDSENYLLDLSKLEKLCQDSPKNKIKGIISVDYAGYPIRSDSLRKLADKYNLWIIEDASHAPGASFLDEQGKLQKVGGHPFSDLTIFSFHPVKHIASGEGGMITTNNPELYEKLLFLRSHGITKDKDKFEQEAHGPWYNEMQTLGFNYRLSDIQAALANNQLKRIKGNLERRKEIANQYDQAFQSLPIKTPHLEEGHNHAYHLYVIQTEKRKELFNFLFGRQIFAQVHYLPVHWHPHYQRLGFDKVSLPVAENFYNQCISLPIYSSLTDEELQYVIDCVKEFFS